MPVIFGLIWVDKLAKTRVRMGLPRCVRPPVGGNSESESVMNKVLSLSLTLQEDTHK